MGTCYTKIRFDSVSFVNSHHNKIDIRKKNGIFPLPLKKEKTLTGTGTCSNSTSSTCFSSTCSTCKEINTATGSNKSRRLNRPSKSFTPIKHVILVSVRNKDLILYDSEINKYYKKKNK